MTEHLHFLGARKIVTFDTCVVYCIWGSAGRDDNETSPTSVSACTASGRPQPSRMRCGWQPLMTPWCGQVCNVTGLKKRSVRLCSGWCEEASWDIELFDASLTRYCQTGCRWQHNLVEHCGSAALLVCDVCGTRVPLGAETRHCNEHDYDICGYCLGHSTLPPVGAKVIQGPTWREDSPPRDKPALLTGLSEIGVVETELLDAATSQSRGDDASKAQGLGYHSYFKVRWMKRGNVSYCGGPPFQDVTLACGIGSAVELMQDFATFFIEHSQAALGCP